MELHEALVNIADIRRRLAAAGDLGNYRARPVAAGALLAFAGAAIQSATIVDPSGELNRYLELWITIAAIAGMLPTLDVYLWPQGAASSRAALTRLACEQFAPCVGAGGMLTAAIAGWQPELSWMLPGLWAVLFSMGLFASFRLMPRAMFAVAAWYLLAGSACLAMGPEWAGLAPWTMALLFGGGQLSTAAVLACQTSEP